MLFSFTKAIFATLAFGVAAVSAIPTPAPANAVAKRSGDDVLALLADVKANIDLDLGKLSMSDLCTPPACPSLTWTTTDIMYPQMRSSPLK